MGSGDAGLGILLNIDRGESMKNQTGIVGEWVEINPLVKNTGLKAELLEYRMLLVNERAIPLLEDDLEVPEHILTALNYQAWIWPLSEGSEKYCLADFSGKSKKPCNGRIYYYRSRSAAVAKAQKNVRAGYQSVINKEERKAEQAAMAAQSYEALEVGDVLASSWGYDQTNVDFYQIIEKIGKQSLMLSKIAGMSSDTGGPTGGHIVPCIDHFIGVPFKKKWSGCVTIASYSRAYPLEYEVIAGAKVYKPRYCSSYH